MNAEQFVYWLQGYLELTHQASITEAQVKIIQDHLNLVFEKKTPDRSDLLSRARKARSTNVLCDGKSFC